ncbi:MarR family winged helix-turn-helix transcriptional regulator [Candidatus Rhodoluna planktonica]|uniref:MarR family transcriptional regulator n=1 Tax=Candidatus Rhodoluna planktonica TaxID=535712 RepID=A0A1D9E0F1_9MICO|nr:MarR family winged helix-turn-helix transcriptional regulator [Candidatus Rhodoluna planktonica]AOY56500.1 MarR family transcriptional regulator [Candidatus Rhodoluna planktonica]
MAGTHTLAETERQVTERLSSKTLDFESMAVVSNLFRAASAARNHFERTVLHQHELSWTAFVVLWVVWIWEPIETRQIAEEGGFSKATLTGVLQTLEGRKLLTREKSQVDGRLVLVKLTTKGRKMMDTLFPEFNEQESSLASVLPSKRKKEVAEALRLITEYAASN